MVDMSGADAVAAAARRMSGGATVLLDGNCPAEEIAAAAEIADAWDGVRLCLALGPDDEQVLLGVEASGAHYLADEELARCDGFVVVGDAFAANPRCARGVLDALQAERRAPMVVIDSGGGVTGSFAALRLSCPAGGELEALQSEQVNSAVAQCGRLGVVVAAEAGRGAGWRRLGYLAGKLASAHGGGVSVQTAGAGALAAVRAQKQLGLICLARAVAPTEGACVQVALGVDVLGLLGWSGPSVPVAAAAVPNETTKSAELILPVALPCETGGTFLHAGTRSVKVAPLLAPPAGVPTPVELFRALAVAAGVKVARWSGKLPALDRLAPGVPPEVARPSANGRMVVAATQPTRDAGGVLAGRATWQSQVQLLPELRVSPADANELGLADLSEVKVETEAHAAVARLRVVDRLAAGTVAVSAGFPEARKLVPYTVDAERDTIVSHPAPVRVGE